MKSAECGEPTFHQLEPARRVAAAGWALAGSKAPWGSPLCTAAPRMRRRRPDRKKHQAGPPCSSILLLPMPTERDIVQLLREIGTRLDCEVSLDVLAARAGWSRFHFHRAFRRIVGETPKRYTNRLRLEGAAARLVTTDEPIASIAARAGFASHAVFTRAFRRQFGRTPAAYRARASGDVRPPGCFATPR
jgi:AraC-like DNA-binding protein